MLDSEYLNGFWRDSKKEDPIITYSQPQFLAGRTQLLHIANSAGQVVVNRVQYGKRSFPIDGSNLVLGIG